MARHSYKITFKDKVITYASKDHVHAVPYRILDKSEMKLMNLMLHDIAEPSFGCSEAEFHSRLTPQMLQNYKDLRKNEFKIITEEDD